MDIETLPLEYPVAFYCIRKGVYLKLADLFNTECDDKTPAFPFYDQIAEIVSELAKAINDVTICAYCRHCTPFTIREKVTENE